MAGSRSRGRDALVLVVVVAVAVPAIVAGSMALGSRGGAATAQPKQTAQAQSSPSAKAQICASCWGDGSPDPTVAGVTEVEDGVQVLRVGLVDGYYEPNEFTVRAGLPVTVIFTGRAEGCLAEPEFPELGVKADLTSGEATVDLGPLDPGTYSFTCSMGVNEGTITAE